MRNSSSGIREQFEHCIGIIRQASTEILSLLDIDVTEGKDPRWFLEQLDAARANLGAGRRSPIGCGSMMPNCRNSRCCCAICNSGCHSMKAARRSVKIS